MFKGTVSFQATIRGNGLKFDRFEFISSETGVEKVEIEGPNGDEIHTTVFFASVPSRDEGKSLAEKVTTAALDRIAFHHGVVIENPRITGHQFSPLRPQPGVIEVECGEYACVGNAASLVLGIAAATLRSKLEQASPPGERNYGLLRSARQSLSPVEEFLHLYNILRMICGDSEEKVDTFIVTHEPIVPQTQHPLKAPGKTETVYTRLRNEFGHNRTGANLATTKTEMANRLGGLVSLVKRAIELNP
jgi:hypothetical protein